MKNLLFLFLITYSCIPKSVDNSNIEYSSKQIIQIDGYCYCLRLDGSIKVNDSTFVGPCTSASPVSNIDLIKKERLFVSITDSLLINNFASEFNLSSIDTESSSINPLIDSRLVFIIKYKDSTIDTLSMNQSGRIILNKHHIMNYKDTNYKLRKLFSNIDSLCL